MRWRVCLELELCHVSYHVCLTFDIDCEMKQHAFEMIIKYCATLVIVYALRLI